MMPHFIAGNTWQKRKSTHHLVVGDGVVGDGCRCLFDNFHKKEQVWEELGEASEAPEAN